MSPHIATEHLLLSWGPMRYILLATFKYTMEYFNYNHHRVYYILMTSLFYHWKSVPFSPSTHCTHPVSDHFRPFKSFWRRCLVWRFLWRAASTSHDQARTSFLEPISFHTCGISPTYIKGPLCYIQHSFKHFTYMVSFKLHTTLCSKTKFPSSKPSFICFVCLEIEVECLLLARHCPADGGCEGESRTPSPWGRCGPADTQPRECPRKEAGAG